MSKGKNGYNNSMGGYIFMICLLVRAFDKVNIAKESIKLIEFTLDELIENANGDDIIQLEKLRG